jgi:aryl-alcohol dehydrogenase-like predicted oxidoreductase
MAGTHLAHPRYKHKASQLLTDENFDKLDSLQAFSMEHGHSVGELAIAWLLSHSWLTSVIAGATTQEQVSANIKAMSWKLTEQEFMQVEQLF